MKDRQQTSFFYIGLFFLIGLGLLLAAIIFFSSKFFMQKEVYAETYFSESVEGLTKGTPIKYLGMEIGKIDTISTVDNVYMIPPDAHHQKEGKYIYVKMSIYPVFFKKSHTDNLGDELQTMIANGLRARLRLQGITGGSYIDMDFVNNSVASKLPISWKPENHYIPSIPSTFSSFSNNVEFFIGELKQLDFKGLVKSIQDFAVTANKLADNSNRMLMNTNSHVAYVFDDLHAIAQDIKRITEEVGADPSAIFFSQQPKPINLEKL